MKIGNAIRAAALWIVTASCAACITASRSPVPGTRQVGDSVFRYQGPDLEMVISTKPAELAVGKERWLVLDVGVNGTRRIVTRLDRENLTLRTPDGRLFPLASQKELTANFDEIEPFLQRTSVARQPLDYYVRDRELCRVPFFAEPGRGTVAEALFVNDRQYCVGPIYFRLEDAVQPGPYELVIVTKGGRGAVPFELPLPKS